MSLYIEMGYLRFHTVFLKIQYKPLLSLSATKLERSVTTGIFIPGVLVTEPKLLNFTAIFDLAY